VEQIETAFLEVVDGNGNLGATFPGMVRMLLPGRDGSVDLSRRKSGIYV
jgi:hypothetical protein